MFDTIVRGTRRHRRSRPLDGRGLRGPFVLAVLTASSLLSAAQAEVPVSPGSTRLRAPSTSAPTALSNVPAPGVGEGLLTRPADMPRTEKRPANDTPSSPWPTILVSLCLVGLVVVAARWWRKHGPKINRGLPDEVLELLGRRPLDIRQSIHLVRLGHRILVLGSSADGLHTLAEIDDPVEVDYLAGLCRQTRDENVVGETFRALFRRREEASDSSVDSERPTSRPAETTTGSGSTGSTRPATAAFPSPSPTRLAAATDEPHPGDGDLRRRLSERLRSPTPTGTVEGHR